MYDAILLDEAQVYLPEELDIFQSLSRRIFAVADSRQRIYDSADSIDALRDFTRVKLEAHYRNGLAICQLADAVAIDTAQQPTLVECSNYDEQARPSTVNDRDAASLDEQCRSAIDLISIELKAYPGEPVGVLTPRRDDAEHIVEVLRQSPLKQNVAHVKDDGALDGTTGHRVIVSTIHSAKGLEFRTVHVLNANRILGFANERNLVFTAITRAKTTLTIHHSGPLPPYLRSALLRNSPVPPLNVRDVFGERR
jgi:superfamily I DNA/RNA helicase